MILFFSSVPQHYDTIFKSTFHKNILPFLFLFLTYLSPLFILLYLTTSGCVSYFFFPLLVSGYKKPPKWFHWKGKKNPLIGAAAAARLSNKICCNISTIYDSLLLLPLTFRNTIFTSILADYFAVILHEPKCLVNISDFIFFFSSTTL